MIIDTSGIIVIAGIAGGVAAIFRRSRPQVRTQQPRCCESAARLNMPCATHQSKEFSALTAFRQAHYGHLPECDPGNCDISGSEYAKREDDYVALAAVLFHVPIDKVTPEMRKDAKTIAFSQRYAS